MGCDCQYFCSARRPLRCQLIWITKGFSRNTWANLSISRTSERLHSLALSHWNVMKRRSYHHGVRAKRSTPNWMVSVLFSRGAVNQSQSNPWTFPNWWLGACCQRTVQSLRFIGCLNHDPVFMQHRNENSLRSTVPRAARTSPEIDFWTVWSSTRRGWLDSLKRLIEIRAWSTSQITKMLGISVDDYDQGRLSRKQLNLHFSGGNRQWRHSLG